MARVYGVELASYRSQAGRDEMSSLGEAPVLLGVGKSAPVGSYGLDHKGNSA